MARWMKDALLYVVVGCASLSLLAFLLFSSRFSINRIEITRDDLHVDNSNVAALMADFKGKSIFTFSKDAASDLIRKNYPEFAQVDIQKILPDTLKINLKTYDIVANIKAYYTLPQVQAAAPPETQQIKEVSDALKTAFDLGGSAQDQGSQDVAPIEQKALLNQIGQAIFDRPEDLQLMTITVDGLTQPIQDRQFVIPSKEMEFILNSIKYLSNVMQMEVQSARYLPTAREIHFKVSNGLVLWLSTDKDYKEQIDKLGAIYKTAELDKENLSYIDLRVREKVIYCPRGQRCDRPDN